MKKILQIALILLLVMLLSSCGRSYVEEDIAMAKSLTEIKNTATNKQALIDGFNKYKDKILPIVFVSEYDVNRPNVYTSKYAMPGTGFVWYQFIDTITKEEDNHDINIFVIADVKYYHNKNEEEPFDHDKQIIRYTFNSSGLLIDVKKY